MNKKGAEMAIGTLVVIVLAVIVLVVIALGFGTGWNNLWGKMTGYFSPVNVDATKQACQYACTTAASYDYCTLTRELSYKDDQNKKQKEKPITCESWRLGLKSDSNGTTITNATLPGSLATQQMKDDLACPEITC